MQIALGIPEDVRKDASILTGLYIRVDPEVVESNKQKRKRSYRDPDDEADNSEKGPKHRLLHKGPEPDLYSDSWHRVWASAYVTDRFANMIDAHAASDMNRQVMEGLARNERDGTLGKVFECYVRHLFFKGGGVRLRKRRDIPRPRSKATIRVTGNNGYPP
jgi:hypothetical protein